MDVCEMTGIPAIDARLAAIDRPWSRLARDIRAGHGPHRNKDRAVRQLLESEDADLVLRFSSV